MAQKIEPTNKSTVNNFAKRIKNVLNAVVEVPVDKG